VMIACYVAKRIYKIVWQRLSLDQVLLNLTLPRLVSSRRLTFGLWLSWHSWDIHDSDLGESQTIA